ncbi:tape measure protein [Arenimonas oryziterrae]|uniref:Tape measure protein N-terminal domain-containing protein n=1 Tax=Arenimonas oryziterrae DSM 21050 = YC6267 TaxID=1121015 RepID=A0A091AQ99_9GAMM|nr:tape measure protein [Arenimonas oryziterrae]KFN42343.1 hypothetical protein N789_14230 [Arenimonas oryziterrae DSM 21050 = YC6267]
MAGNGRFDEAVRIAFELEGEGAAVKAAGLLAEIGDVSEEAKAQAAGLLDEFSDAQRLQKTIVSYRELGSELLGLSRKLKDSKEQAQKLSREIADSDAPTKKQQAAYEKSQRLIRQLSEQYESSIAKLRGYRTALASADISVGKLGAAEQALNTRLSAVGRGLAALRDQTVEMSRAQATNTARLREADAQFNRLTSTTNVAVKSLGEYRAKALQAAGATTQLGNAGNSVGGIFGRLRGVVAGAFAFLGFQGAAAGIKALGDVAARAEDARRSLGNLYGTQEQGNAAYKSLQDLAKKNGLAFQDVLTSAQKLKAFGLDPLNGSLQALVDQNAAVGGTQVDLEGKILALGQAWAKQKLQGEEILQLVERGVPVWDLLQKATGKNVTELQKLSEQGKLGRDVIAALYAEIGKANQGAAQRGLGSLSGLLAQASAQWQRFLQAVADSGVTDYFKQQLGSLLASTGGLDALAKRVAAAIIGTIEAIKNLAKQLAPIASFIGSVTLSLLKHADALLLVAKAYAAIRIADFAANVTRGFIAMQASTIAAQQLGTAATGASAGVGRLSGFISQVPRFLKISVATLGIDIAVNQLIRLNEVRNEYIETLRNQEVAEAAVRSLRVDSIRQGEELQRIYTDYADVVVQSGGQVKAQTLTQAEAYRLSLESAKRYYEGVIRVEAANNKVAGPEVVARFRAVTAAIDEVNGHIKDLGNAARAEAGVREFATKAVASFDELILKGKSAKDAAAGVFDSLRLTTPEGLKSAADILTQIGAKGSEAAAAIRDELRAELLKLSEQDLSKVKSAAKDAFSEGSTEAKKFADVTRGISLERLGVDIEEVKTGFSKAGRAAVDGFRAAVEEVDTLGLTAEQKSKAIAQAFDNAFKNAASKQELAALRQALVEALSAGTIGFSEFSARVSEVDKKLADLGKTGNAATGEIATGAVNAADALGSVSTAAEAVVDSGDELAASADKVVSAFDRQGASAADLVAELGRGSEAYNDALLAANRFASVSQDRFADAINRTVGEFKGQTDAINEQLQVLREQNAEFDETGKRLAGLRQLYGFVGDDALQALAAEQAKLEENRKKREESAQKQLSDTERQAAADQRATTAAAREAVKPEATLRLEVVAIASESGQKFILSGDQMEELVRRVVQLLALHKKSSS